jgi:cobalamin synthase
VSYWSDFRAVEVPVWAKTLIGAFGAMGGLLIGVIDATFLFKGTAFRFGVIFLISWVVISSVLYAEFVDRKLAVNRREEAVRKARESSTRTAIVWSLAGVVVAVIWLFRAFGWLWN